MTIKVNKLAAQGDLLIQRIEENEIPKDAAIIKGLDNQYIVAHSETGHHHTVPQSVGILMRDPVNQFVMYLKVTAPEAEFTHNRSFDRHEALSVGPGTYKLTNQREFSPLGWAKALD